ncbi:unnamed protein product [Amoebophrya sp. A25]|nr:unnamed protein product [Amoebophrya sp. A25]|eukprot:GSA25T00016882001.1
MGRIFRSSGRSRCISSRSCASRTAAKVAFGTAVGVSAVSFNTTGEVTTKRARLQDEAEVASMVQSFDKAAYISKHGEDQVRTHLKAHKKEEPVDERDFDAQLAATILERFGQARNRIEEVVRAFGPRMESKTSTEEHMKALFTAKEHMKALLTVVKSFRGELKKKIAREREKKENAENTKARLIRDNIVVSEAGVLAGGTSSLDLESQKLVKVQDIKVEIKKLGVGSEILKLHNVLVKVNIRIEELSNDTANLRRLLNRSRRRRRGS